ncbi:hypothetical protein ALO43_200021 [Pseudomonas tremae]|uniref:O-acetylhomoserine aminocarboxypropyltransferase n=1 Tax=Pseudomonas tremae TaxID=200454 RepID=A0AA40P7Y0_9PSED|nr:hypothetical protein ALO43_200021 [Pseudomonas tremae]
MFATTLALDGHVSVQYIHERVVHVLQGAAFLPDNGVANAYLGETHLHAAFIEPGKQTQGFFTHAGIGVVHAHEHCCVDHWQVEVRHGSSPGPLR